MIIALVGWLVGGRTYSRNMHRVKAREQEEEKEEEEEGSRNMNDVNVSAAVEVIKA